MKSLTVTAASVLSDAVASENGRSSALLAGGSESALRQVIVGLAAGRSMNEHENPGEATIQVLTGRVRLHTAEQSWELSAGDWMQIPRARHGVDSLADSAILLTVAKT